jgi:hypothetical protein
VRQAGPPQFLLHADSNLDKARETFIGLDVAGPLEREPVQRDNICPAHLDGDAAAHAINYGQFCVFIVSGRIHGGRRKCKCGRSEGFVEEGRKSGGSVWIV